MHTMQLTTEQVADQIGAMTIAEATDMGGALVHQGSRPTHGEVVAVSSAVGPCLVIAKNGLRRVA